MKIHREGWESLAILSIVFAFILMVSSWSLSALLIPFGIIYLILFFFLLHFFRNPARPITNENANLIYAPADGKVVVIEEVEESEYLEGKAIQLSIFMSPLNVHVNRVPTPGKVEYLSYFPGKYLVAWHPKSSTENERSSIGIIQNGKKILLKQIAGALARRICCYVKVGQELAQGSELGFIKFGSRVDLYLPADTKIKVEIGQTVRSNVDVIAEW